MAEEQLDPFTSARRLADAADYDAAIDACLAGLRLDPDNLTAHKDLWTIALRRKAAGGRSAGMFQRMRLLRSKGEPLDRLLAAERVLTYNPGDLDALEAMLNAARAGRFERTAEWIADIVSGAMSSTGRT